MKEIIGIVICSILLGGCLTFGIAYEFGKQSQSDRLEAITTSLDGIEKDIYTQMEYAYFEGQKDAIEGNLRIKKVDSCYVWTKSTWDNCNKPNTYIIPCNN